MKTQYYTATSLDGFIADPNHSLDWLFQFRDSPTDDYTDFIANIGAVVMGSSTYEWLINHMRKENGELPAWPYTQPTWIFTTRTLPRFENAEHVRFVRGDVVPVHAEMAAVADGKNIWVVGGGDLAGQFYDRGLLDELIVTIASVTLGSGMPLLPRAIVKPPLRLTSAQAFGADFVQLRYDVHRY